MAEFLASRRPVAKIAADIRSIAPGLALAAAVGAAAFAAEPWIARALPIPAMVIALFLGIALNSVAERPNLQPGIAFCVRTLLRIAVALLGLRIAIGEIVALGATTALIVVLSMAITIVGGFVFARAFGRNAPYGALVGAGTAVCGASATLATSTVVPDYKGKAADTVFVVIAVNAFSTVAMVLYPLACSWLAFNQHETGIMLGATIHDVAQVVGAGYAVSETTGNTAVIVKLFRVLLLLPVVLAIGWWFARRGGAASDGRVPVPAFAIAFLALCVINSVMPSFPSLGPIYAPLKDWLTLASTWGLMIAIAALGLGTSFGAVAALGWRHVATVCGTTFVILLVVTAQMLVLR